MARARIGSLPERSASRITPSRRVCDSPRRAGGQAHHLQRAAADIGQDAVGGGDAAQHALGGVFGLLQARQDADRHAGHAGFQGGDEIRAVLRVAHRGGGEHFERIGAHRARHRVVAVQHGEGLRHAFLVQPPGRRQAAAQAQHRLLIEDAERVAAVSLEHHQADRVGPEIDHAAARQVGRRRIRHAVGPYGDCGLPLPLREGVGGRGRATRTFDPSPQPPPTGGGGVRSHPPV